MARFNPNPGAGRGFNAGGPTSITAEVTAVVVKNIRGGTDDTTAAARAGISKTTHDWAMRLGSDPASAVKQSPERNIHPRTYKACREYFVAVSAAQGDIAAGMANVLARSALGAKAEYDQEGRLVREEVPADPKDALVWLERRRPDEWRRSDELRLRPILDRELDEVMERLVPYFQLRMPDRLQELADVMAGRALVVDGRLVMVDEGPAQLPAVKEDDDGTVVRTELEETPGAPPREGEGPVGGNPP